MGVSPMILDRLSFQYPAYPGLPAQRLLKNISLTLKPGGLHIIIGAPGVGKTTLSRLMMGLLPRYGGGEKGGRVFLGEREIEEWEPRDILIRGGLLFQDSEEQILMTRCDGEVAFALESLGLPVEEMEVRVANAMEWMGLSGFEGRNPATLSGGEQKRILLAAMRAQDPPLWILDETLEELDSAAGKNLLDTLLGEGKTVVLFVSKYMPFLGAYDSEWFLLKEGFLSALGREAGEREAALNAEGLGFFPPPGSVKQEASSGVPFMEVENLFFSYGEGRILPRNS